MNVICEYVKIHVSIFDTDKDKYDFVLENIILEDGYKRMFVIHLWYALDLEFSYINIIEFR